MLIPIAFVNVLHILWDMPVPIEYGLKYKILPFQKASTIFANYNTLIFFCGRYKYRFKGDSLSSKDLFKCLTHGSFLLLGVWLDRLCDLVYLICYNLSRISFLRFIGWRDKHPSKDIRWIDCICSIFATHPTDKLPSTTNRPLLYVSSKYARCNSDVRPLLPWLKCSRSLGKVFYRLDLGSTSLLTPFYGGLIARSMF